MGPDGSGGEAGAGGPWLSATDWRRRGGHEVQFFCTDLDMVALLSTALPGKHAPYSVEGSVGGWTPSTRRDVSMPPERILDIAGFDVPDRHVVMFLRACALHPSLPPADDVTDFLASSGLIQVEHGGLIPGGQRDTSRFAFVERVESVRTGEVVRHAEYASVFAALKRAVRRLATVPTQTWDGHPGWPMTPRAAMEHAAGLHYKHAPRTESGG